MNIIQLMTFDEVNTRIDQPMEHDIHRGIRSEYVPWVDQSLYHLIESHQLYNIRYLYINNPI